ncbi:UMP kinase [Candidatus Xenohaliotis californiensis]|uniref:Uridylate kinase n=1 Tax=Candidatus Xenohaliotis californiensis TaxID=84677 RepID=A0ABM9N8C4_9RICK|nr:UMP kinase [Candidatus Xenohaliotis californiensis]
MDFFTMQEKPNRVLIKVSGEALAGKVGFGLDNDKIARIASDISILYKMDIEICLVIGGGNILRGSELSSVGFVRTTADYMGMIATIINALALQNAIEKSNIVCRVLSSIPITAVCEPYIKRRAVRHMEKKRIVIFAAGTGNPFFSTDTAAVLRAIETDCNILIKATQVDGVYSSDPKKNSNAERFKKVSYDELLSKNLKVMDAAAIALAKDNNIPIMVCKLDEILNVINGNGLYTLIKN